MTTRQRAHLIAMVACTLFFGASFADAPDTTSIQKLQLLMEQSRARVASVAASGPSTQALLSPSRLQERAQLLTQAESALLTNDVTAAQQAFERAALISHAADTEMGLVRTHMQAGQYRRALAFGAHAAGAHLDVVGGAALYAWLLQIGGQEAAAKRMLADALTRSPNHPLLIAAQKQLQSGHPVANDLLLQAPVRMAPYGPLTALPAGARVAGSGVLFDNGKRVLVPLTTLGSSHRVWVRNGLGQLVLAHLEKKYPHLNVAAMTLHRVLPVDAPLTVPAKDAFPGSVAFAVEYSPSPNATPQWPVLSTGILGEPSPDGKGRALGIALAKGPRGGPVFDNMGRFVGMAVAGTAGSDQLVPSSQLTAILGLPAEPAAKAPDFQRMPIDQIFELAMHTTVQIITKH
jgi:hypothetical protein